MFRLAVHLFGFPSIQRDGAPIEIDRRKGIALLAYLALSNQSQSRDALATLLWPEYDRTRARAALRRTLAALIEAIGGTWLEVDWESLKLKADSDIWVDVNDFHNSLAECKTHGHPATDVCPACLNPLTTAATLYHEDFLAGFTLRDTANFDEWQVFQTETLRCELVSALARLVRIHKSRGEYEQAVTFARRWVAIDSFDEPAHRELMQLFAWIGETGAALRQYDDCARLLAELGVAPQAETTQLYKAIKGKGIVSPPTQPAGTSTRIVSQGKHNLPSQATHFIGRQEELTQINELLEDPTCQLVTIIGPGGIGKTRLALEVGMRRVGQYPDGVRFIPLAHISSADFLVSAIAGALELSFYGRDDPKVQLLNHLCEKDLLLILDNLEHLLEGVGLLTDILQSAPAVKLLVTSRERLRLQAEWAIEIRGLQVPASAQAEGLTESSALQLFAQSARRVNSRFTLSADQVPHIIRLCQLVEGAPLGIELAAAWTRMLACAHIVREMEKSFDILNTSFRDFPERHQSMRAVFEHSWNLLSGDERRACRWLSVCRNGFRKHIAQRMAGASLGVLSSLADKSFLRWELSGRFQMHELLRHYAEEKLRNDPDESERALDLHCDTYADFVKYRENALKGGRQREALDEIAEEIENVRLGWHRAIEQDRQDAIANFSEGLYLYYDMRSWFSEGAEAFESAAQKLGRLGARTRQIDLNLAKAIARQARFCLRLARYDQAEELFQTSLAIARRLEARDEIAFCLCYLGELLRVRGDLNQAAQMIETSLAIARDLGNDFAIARALNILGIVQSVRGQYADAKHSYAEGLAIHERLGDRRNASTVIGNLGNIANLQQDYAEAKRLLHAGMQIHNELGDRRGLVRCMGNLAEIAHKLGEHREAEQLLLDSFPIRKEIGDRWNIAYALNSLGAVTLALGEFSRSRDYFRQALKTAMDLRAPPLVLDIFSSMAAIYKREGDEAQARELLMLAFYHPASGQETKDRAQALLTEMELTPLAAIVNVEPAKAELGNLESVVERLLR